MNYLAIVLCLVMAIGLNGKSIIIANYHNVIMFFPRELGGNDDVRVIFDVRNVTDGTVNTLLVKPFGDIIYKVVLLFIV